MSVGAVPTYFVQGVLAGGAGGGNKDMLTLLNTGSKTLRVWKIIVQAFSTSGSNVVVQYDLQTITAHAGGTLETVRKRDSADAASSGVESRSGPSSVTGATTIWSFAIQSNTAQAPNAHVWDLGGPAEKPLVLRPNEGLNLFQPTANNGSFALTYVWTEE